MHPNYHIPVLTVQDAQLRNLDPQDPKDLSVMWSAFSKVSPLVENGERLRNLSWRLWNREALRYPNQPSSHHLLHKSSPRDVPRDSNTPEVPGLSKSVDSDTSDTSNGSADPACPKDPSQPAFAEPALLSRFDDQRSDNSRERHITPQHLQNLVLSIKEKQSLEPLPPSRAPSPPTTITMTQSRNIPDVPPPPSAPRPVNTESSTSTVATVATDSFNSPDTKSDTSISSSEDGSHRVVRGFTPGTGVTSYTSKTQLAPAEPRPILKTSGSNAPTNLPKKRGMFMLGCSSGEDENSLPKHLSIRSHPLSADTQGSTPMKKQTSFKDEVMVMREAQNAQAKSSAVLDSDDESEDDESDSEVSESAIEEDDEDAWEDDPEDSKPEDEIKFYRVDSKANLSSRRSAITLNLEEQRNNGSLHNSRSTPALQHARSNKSLNGPSMPASPEEESILEMKRHEMPASKPVIMTTSNTSNANPAPLPSPGTLRRNMFCGELSESLRKNMLTERKQKNPLGSSSIQTMKRAHTAFDVPKLGQVPEHSEAQPAPEQAKSASNGRKMSFNHYFDHSVGEYHQAGW